MNTILQTIEDDTKRGIADLKAMATPGAASTAESNAPATISSFAAKPSPIGAAAPLSATSSSNIPVIVQARLAKLKDLLNIVGDAPATYDRAVDLVVATIDPKAPMDMAAEHDTLKKLLTYAGADLTGFDEAVALANAFLVTAK